MSNFSLFDRLHGWFYLRFPYLYISIGLGTHPIARFFTPFFNLTNRAAALFLKKSDTSDAGIARGYHGKTITLKSARQMVRINQEIRLENLEHIIPFEQARDIILKNPDHIAVIDCPCRKAVPNPCLPLDVCLIIGEPFVAFAIEHHPKSARRITPQEAEQILIDEDKRGHAHHAFFKDAMLGRFYAICNCCSCCCGAMKAQRNGIPMIISSGFLCVVDEALCVGCGVCAQICPFNAIEINQVAIINAAVCMGCGICLQKCSQGALSLAHDQSRPVPLEIESLIHQMNN